MIETEVDAAAMPPMRRLRGLIMLPPAAIDAPAGEASGWRDDLRLFLTAWAAGFLFFMVLIA